MDWGDLFGKLATSFLGSLVSGVAAQSLNLLFAPSPPSRRDTQRDLQMQADVMRQATEPRAPVRTPEQAQSDQLAVQQTQARQATFAKLSKEYDTLQQAGPSVLWNPYEEQQIRQEAMADAAMRGMAESGQAQELVKRRLDEARMGRSQEAARLHEQKLSDLRTQMAAYSGVVQPGGGAVTTPPAPTVSPLPRTMAPFATQAPIDIVAAMRDDRKKPPSDTMYSGSPYAASPGY